MQERWVKTRSVCSTTTGGKTTEYEQPVWVNMAWVMSISPSVRRKGGACIVFAIGSADADDDETGVWDALDPPQHFLPPIKAF